jgi:hypothetical protein
MRLRIGTPSSISTVIRSPSASAWGPLFPRKDLLELEWKTVIDVEEPARRLGDLDSWKAYLGSSNFTESPGARPGYSILWGITKPMHHHKRPKRWLPCVSSLFKGFPSIRENLSSWSTPGPGNISISALERYDFSPINEDLPVNIAFVSLLTAIATQFNRSSVEDQIGRKKLTQIFAPWCITPAQRITWKARME